MLSPPKTQHLICTYGDTHPWSRDSKRGPRPARCIPHTGLAAPEVIEARGSLEDTIAPLLASLAGCHREVDRIVANHLFGLLEPKAAAVIRLAYGFTDPATDSLRFTADFMEGQLLTDNETGACIGLTDRKVWHLRTGALAAMRAEIATGPLEAHYLAFFAEIRRKDDAERSRQKQVAEQVIAQQYANGETWLNPNGNYAPAPAPTKVPMNEELPVPQPKGGPSAGIHRPKAQTSGVVWGEMSVPEGNREGRSLWDRWAGNKKKAPLHRASRTGTAGGTTKEPPLLHHIGAVDVARCGPCFLEEARDRGLIAEDDFAQPLEVDEDDD